MKIVKAPGVGVKHWDERGKQRSVPYCIYDTKNSD